jgi:hypothetical protein
MSKFGFVSWFGVNMLCSFLRHHVTQSCDIWLTKTLDWRHGDQGSILIINVYYIFFIYKHQHVLYVCINNYHIGHQNLNFCLKFIVCIPCPNIVVQVDYTKKPLFDWTKIPLIKLDMFKTTCSK